jgi:hypothetical protein
LQKGAARQGSTHARVRRASSFNRRQSFSNPWIKKVLTPYQALRVSYKLYFLSRII